MNRLNIFCVTDKPLKYLEDLDINLVGVGKGQFSQKYIYWFNLFSLFGFSSILMTYFGVNYYLDGLHSYAAGDAFPIPSFVLPTLVILIIISLCGFFRFNKWLN